jgi:uncharacterized protein (DUF427 family)
MWAFTGRKRPSFAETPGPRQESVWDYPRPPKLIPDKRRVVVKFSQSIIADSTATYRVLETASPPTFYIPPKDVRMEMLQPFPGASICEWKGTARYWGLNISSPAGQAVGWTYPTAQVPYGPISGYFSFYPVVWNAWSITSVFARNPASSMVAGSRKKSSAKGERGTENW